LELQSGKLGDFGGVVVSEIVGHADCKLTWLYLSGNGLGDAGATAIALALTHNTLVRTVLMHNNGVGNAGATAIASMLRHNTAIEELSLYENVIGDDGVIALGKALLNNTALKYLYLALNEVSEKGVAQLDRLLVARITLPGASLNSYFKKARHRHHHLEDDMVHERTRGITTDLCVHDEVVWDVMYENTTDDARKKTPLLQSKTTARRLQERAFARKHPLVVYLRNGSTNSMTDWGTSVDLRTCIARHFSAYGDPQFFTLRGSDGAIVDPVYGSESRKQMMDGTIEPGVLLTFTRPASRRYYSRCEEVGSIRPISAPPPLKPHPKPWKQFHFPKVRAAVGGRRQGTGTFKKQPSKTNQFGRYSNKTRAERNATYRAVKVKRLRAAAAKLAANRTTT
jgi:hypothetical protein